MAVDIPVYQTPEEMEAALDSYFPWCEEHDMVPNIVGMALHIGFASRMSFCDYEKKSAGFLHVIRRAKSKCYNQKFSQAIKGKLNPTIFIFDAVNNHDMFNTRSENKNDNEHTGSDGGPIRHTWTTEVVEADGKR